MSIPLNSHQPRGLGLEATSRTIYVDGHAFRVMRLVDRGMDIAGSTSFSQAAAPTAAVSEQDSVVGDPGSSEPRGGKSGLSE